MTKSFLCSSAAQLLFVAMHAGDTAAREAFCTAAWSALNRIAREVSRRWLPARLRDREDDEVVSATWEALLQSTPNAAALAVNLTGYVAYLARNASRTVAASYGLRPRFRRGANSRVAPEMGDEPLTDDVEALTDPWPAVEARMVYTSVVDAAANDEPLRQALELVYSDGDSIGEAASRIGMTRSTVSRTLKRHLSRFHTAA
jgi:DNA-directed RNA polymerase specialized sigma24 family protein